MKKRFRNPATGETIILEEEGEESVPTGPKPATSSGSRENPGEEKTEAAEDKEPESGEDEGEKTGDESGGEFRTPFDFLDEIDGKDVEKVAIGAALGIGGMLALRGLFSFIARD